VGAATHGLHFIRNTTFIDEQQDMPPLYGLEM
jgi:hypothetical protein